MVIQEQLEKRHKVNHLWLLQLFYQALSLQQYPRIGWRTWGPESLLVPSTSWDGGLSAPLTSASHWHDEIPGSWQTEVLPQFMASEALPPPTAAARHNLSQWCSRGRGYDAASLLPSMCQLLRRERLPPQSQPGLDYS